MTIIKNSLVFCLLALAWLILPGTVQAVKCNEPAEVTVIIRDTDKNFIPQAKFTIYQQLEDVDGNKTIGKSIGGGRIDTYLGNKIMKVYPDTEINYYILKVDSPSGANLPHWFTSAMNLTCDKKTSVTVYLSALEVVVTDSQGQLLKNSNFTIYKQGVDIKGDPLVLEKIGNFDTGDQGKKRVYLPSHNTMLGEPFDYYAIEFKNKKGKLFYRYNINVVDQKIKSITYALSDLEATLYDGDKAIPGADLSLYQEIIAPDGKFTTGKLLAKMKTDNQGKAYLQYPAGTYLLQYKHADQSLTNFNNIVIKDQVRTSKNFFINASGKDTGRCQKKIILKPSFRNYYDQIVPNLKFTIYEQGINNDEQAVQGKKLTSNKTDQDGIGQASFYVTPVNNYIMEVCDKITKFGCFEFKNLQFECDNQAVVEKRLNQVDVILRDVNKQLKIGREFRIYPRTTDIDGRPIIDKNKGYGKFKLPDSGKFTFYLADKYLNGNSSGYVIMVVSDSKQELYANFNINSFGVTHLEYIVRPDKLIWIKPVEDPMVKNTLGKILLQVEKHGEAWYVNPTDRKRYYLGRPADAYAVMRQLGVGITNVDLAKIPVDFDITPTGVDSDKDGLIDVFEKGLLTDWTKADSDNDGYSDLDELKNGYNPNGSGRLSYDMKFSDKQKGKILLQVEGYGEAWYVNPDNSFRYYLSRAKDAFAIMRQLGLGITNANLAKIPIGQIN